MWLVPPKSRWLSDSGLNSLLKRHEKPLCPGNPLQVTRGPFFSHDNRTYSSYCIFFITILFDCMVITRNDPGTLQAIATYVFSLQVWEMEEMEGYQHVSNTCGYMVGAKKSC